MRSDLISFKIINTSQKKLRNEISQKAEVGEDMF